MADEKSVLEAVKGAFQKGNYAEAETLLKSLSKDDPQVQHNLAVVHFLKKDIDAEEALRRLGPEDVNDFTDKYKTNVVLRYEGHETALYNKAVLLAQCGLPHESILLLRGLLALWKDLPKTTLAYTLCMFQILTRPCTSLHHQSRQKSDEELINTIVKDHPEFSTDSEYKPLFDTAFVKADGLQEVFKGKEGEVNQVAYLNDLGVLLLDAGKSNVASLCFAKAGKTAIEKDLSSQSRVIYNTALCALLCENYDEAIRNFLRIQETMKHSPLFWLRFAEAAVKQCMALREIRRRQEYERDQEFFRQELSAGKLLPNFEFLMLPGARTVPGPTQQEASKEDASCTAMEQLATSAIQNALFLLIPAGQTYDSVATSEAFRHNELLLTHTMLTWMALELMRKNYSVVVEAGQKLLSAHTSRPLSAAVHTTLLCYLVEALIELNDAERALRVLRQTSLSHLLTGHSERTDGVQRCRIEILFLDLAVTQILNGSWTQAHHIMDSLLGKLLEGKSSSGTEYRPEQEVLFAYQMLGIFLELCQGNREKAAEQLSKLSWVL